MATLPKTHFTPEEYLELERKAESKSEYSNGEIFAMSGVGRKHDDIVAQLQMLLGQHLRGGGCRTQTADLRVRVTPNDYVYPDLSVVCGKRQFADTHLDTLINPTLLVEVLSPTTERYDRGQKAYLYRRIESLQQLLLISQDEYSVELHTRQPDGSWVLKSFTGLDASVELASIGYTLHLRELYERVIEDQV